LLHALERFSTGAGLAAHLPGALLLEDGAQIVPNRGIVIDHQNSSQNGFCLPVREPMSRSGPKTFGSVFY
jgi:hypothetical protein